MSPTKQQATAEPDDLPPIPQCTHGQSAIIQPHSAIEELTSYINSYDYQPLIPQGNKSCSQETHFLDPIYTKLVLSPQGEQARDQRDNIPSIFHQHKQTQPSVPQVHSHSSVARLTAIL
jgi:hypothetical protein